MIAEIRYKNNGRRLLEGVFEFDVEKNVKAYMFLGHGPEGRQYREVLPSRLVDRIYLLETPEEAEKRVEKEKNQLEDDLKSFVCSELEAYIAGDSISKLETAEKIIKKVKEMLAK